MPGVLLQPAVGVHGLDAADDGQPALPHGVRVYPADVHLDARAVAELGPELVGRLLDQLPGVGQEQAVAALPLGHDEGREDRLAEAGGQDDDGAVVPGELVVHGRLGGELVRAGRPHATPPPTASTPAA